MSAAARTAESPSSKCPAGSRSSSVLTNAARAGGTLIRRLSKDAPVRSTPLPALTAESPSQPTGTGAESIVPTPATSQGALEVTAMNEDQFEREKLYQASMNMFQAMLKDGLITEEQYAN